MKQRRDLFCNKCLMAGRGRRRVVLNPVNLKYSCKNCGVITFVRWSRNGAVYSGKDFNVLLMRGMSVDKGIAKK